MHHRAKDISGLKVGYLTARSYAGSDGRKSLWLADCACGATVKLPASELQKMAKRGVVASCGCKRNETISRRLSRHGMTSHPAFAVWRSMVDRCRLPSHQAWRNYGGRGIAVCDRWAESFENFWADMGPSYQGGLSLDRIDNDGPYSPQNCRWVSAEAQANNRRGNVFLDTPKGRLTVAQAARAFRISTTTLLYRISAGCPPERLFDQPNFRNRFTT